MFQCWTALTISLTILNICLCREENRIILLGSLNMVLESQVYRYWALAEAYNWQCVLFLKCDKHTFPQDMAFDGIIRIWSSYLAAPLEVVLAELLLKLFTLYSCIKARILLLLPLLMVGRLYCSIPAWHLGFFYGQLSLLSPGSFKNSFLVSI